MTEQNPPVVLYLFQDYHDPQHQYKERAAQYSDLIHLSRSRRKGGGKINIGELEHYGSVFGN